MHHYAVMGHPIAHSQSPQIHAAFAAQTKQRVTYQAILVEKTGFADAVTDFLNQGGKGINVTIPFKGEAWSLVQQSSERAARAKAVNTIKLCDDGLLYGDNTDGVGLVRDLTINHGLVVKGKTILILGAGGAVRGIVGALLDEEPKNIVIANRTISRAVEIADSFSGQGDIRARGLNALIGATFDMIINGTAAGLQGKVPALPNRLPHNTYCYDMTYASNADTPFVNWAKAHGAKMAMDGLGMLVEQAAESFFIWRGVRPNTDEVITMLRQP